MPKVIFSILLFVFFLNPLLARDIKEADLAGAWYPADPAVLREQITTYLNNASLPSLREEVIGLILPHAGLSASGDTAAYGLKAVADKKIDTVVLVGFSHRMNYDGVAVFDPEGFKTPLGVIYTDKNLVREITARSKQFFPSAEPFKGENSLELIIPFIQVALDNPQVLLLAIGKQSFENSLLTGEAIYELLKDRRNFLVIASTDLSHYLPYAEAVKMDEATVEQIKLMNPERLFESCYLKNRMCGAAAVTAVMIVAKKLGANRVEVLKESTSARTLRPDEPVVGYLSAVFLKDHKPGESGEERAMATPLNAEQKEGLLKLARDTIGTYLNKQEARAANTADPLLNEVRGVFVTLHKNGQLRGCIGNIIGRQPLYTGVRDMAIASATQDPRFPPLTAAELPHVEIEISVLSPLKKVDDPADIILGEHGVLVRKGFHSGVYLPQVATETGWSKQEFMDSLCAHKAGIEPRAWQTGECEIYVFTAEVFSE